MYKTLIVDDTEINLIELERLGIWNESTGFAIAQKAKNGSEALSYLRVQRFDLVITDIRMPKMDGIVLLEEIRNEKLCDCVALLSEHCEFAYAQRGILLGAFEYLVKPAERSAIRGLLQRARDFLDAKGQLDFVYPRTEEENLIALIGIQNKAVPVVFEELAEGVGRLTQDRLLSADITRKVYNNLVHAIFEIYPWLLNFVPIGKYERFFSGAEGDMAARYARSLSELIGVVEGFVFKNVPNTIREICDFILTEPESDVSLQSTSVRFDINNTYLSNLFRQKTGLRFNEYLTAVKMARAKYYLENTEMKIGEISYILGYNDFDYFNRLFKKYNELTPTSYRRNLAAELA